MLKRRDLCEGVLYDENEFTYGWLVKTIVAAIIFFSTYIAHISGSTLGKWVDYGVEKVLTSEVDFVYLKYKLIKLLAQNK